MKVKDVMTVPAVRIHPKEPVSVAARTLAHYNLGVLPVCGNDGRVCGLVTDRDLVIRCLAAGRKPEQTLVQDVMTAQIIAAKPEMDVGAAAHLMGRAQVRRLPVIENGKLCGMVGLGDLACREESVMDAADALADITSNVSDR